MEFRSRVSACARCLRTPRNNYSHERVRAAVAINSSSFWLILMQPESCERASTATNVAHGYDRSFCGYGCCCPPRWCIRANNNFVFFFFLFSSFRWFFVLSFCYGKSLLRPSFLMESRCSHTPICFSLQRDCIRKWKSSRYRDRTRRTKIENSINFITRLETLSSRLLLKLAFFFFSYQALDFLYLLLERLWTSYPSIKIFTISCSLSSCTRYLCARVCNFSWERE